MGVATWGLVILILYPLVQVPAALYLTRHTRLREGETPGRDGWEYGAHHPDSHADPDREAGQCLDCGAGNDPEFRYCRACGARIGVPGR